MGEECENLSASFFLNHDPRGGYTALPKFHRNLSITSQLWMAWLRSLLPPEHWKEFDQSTSRKKIALHHFHPDIIKLCSNGRVCELVPTIDQKLVDELNLNLPEEEKVRDESGNMTSEYFVTPSYSFEDARNDLEQLRCDRLNVSTAVDATFPLNPTKAEIIDEEVKNSLNFELSQPLDSSRNDLMEPLVTEDHDDMEAANKEDQEDELKKWKNAATVPKSIIIEIEPNKNRDKLKKKLRDLEATAIDLLPSRRFDKKRNSSRSVRSLSVVSRASSSRSFAPSTTSAPVTKSEVSRLEAQKMAYKAFMEQQKRAMEKQKEIQARGLAQQSLHTQQRNALQKQIEVTKIVEESDDEDLYLTSEEEEESIELSEEEEDGWEDEDDEDSYDEDAKEEYEREEIDSDSTTPSETRHCSGESGEESGSIDILSESELSPVDVEKEVLCDSMLESQHSPCDVKFMFLPPHDLREDFNQHNDTPEGIFDGPTNSSADFRPDFQKQPLDRNMRDIFTSTKSLQIFDGDDTSSCPSLDSDCGEPHENLKGNGFLWSNLVQQQAQLASDWHAGDKFRAEGYQAGPKAFAALSKQKNPSNHPWRYTRHDRFYSNSILDGFVPDRSSPGRILLHIVVRDENGTYVEDLAVGCYHPYAYDLNQVMKEDCRVLWTATRKKIDSWSKLDTLLDSAQYTPLENGMEMKSSDVRAVYGEFPPVETVFITESDFAGELNDFFETENDLESKFNMIDAIEPRTNMSFALLEMFMRCQVEI